MLLEEKNPHGGYIYGDDVEIDFSANISPFGTPEAIKQSMIKAVNELDKYPDPYCLELRHAISKHEEVDISSILCSNGAAEMIFSFIFALNPKKVVLIAPTFCEYERATLSVNSEINYYFLKEENNFEIGYDFLDCISSDCDAVFLCNPNNPVGNLCNKDLLLKIANECNNKCCYLFLDECFMDLVFEPKEQSLIDEAKNNSFIFVLKAFTKSYGLAGLRLGYSVCYDKELLNRMCQIGQIWNVSHMAQKAGVTAIACSEYINDLRDFFIKERWFLRSELESLGIKVFDGNANFLFFKSTKNLYNKLIKKGLCIRDCSNFNGLEAGFYRIAVRNRNENIMFINAIKEILLNG